MFIIGIDTKNHTENRKSAVLSIRIAFGALSSKLDLSKAC